jgi:thioredoxin reductase (NADPH)
LTRFADKVTLLVRGDALTANQILIDQVTNPKSRIDIKYNTVVEAFEGEGSKLSTVRVRDRGSGTVSELHPAAAFIFIGQEPNSDFVGDYVKRDRYGYILTGHDVAHGLDLGEQREPYAFETSAPGVFAAGDVRSGSTKQVASAVGEGAAASISIREFLKTQ